MMDDINTSYNHQIRFLKWKTWSVYVVVITCNFFYSNPFEYNIYYIDMPIKY